VTITHPFFTIHMIGQKLAKAIFLGKNRRPNSHGSDKRALIIPFCLIFS